MCKYSHFITRFISGHHFLLGSFEPLPDFFLRIIALFHNDNIISTWRCFSFFSFCYSILTFFSLFEKKEILFVVVVPATNNILDISANNFILFYLKVSLKSYAIFKIVQIDRISIFEFFFYWLVCLNKGPTVDVYRNGKTF